MKGLKRTCTILITNTLPTGTRRHIIQIPGIIGIPCIRHIRPGLTHGQIIHTIGMTILP